jgi:catechol 2,3-dioxygenase-like lactoylglutathione lyase family enzyme
LSESLKSVGAITMFIEDPSRSKSFYEQVFGVTAIYEDDDAVAFQFENMIVNLLKTAAAHELIEPAAVAGADAGSRFQLTIGVDDVDAVCSELAAKGVQLLNGPIDREWGMRTAAFTDPDGHIWEVAAKILEDG